MKPAPTCETESRNAKIIRKIKAYTRHFTQTPEMAREALIREGIYNDAGQLLPEFGGEHHPTGSEQ